MTSGRALPVALAFVALSIAPAYAQFGGMGMGVVASTPEQFSQIIKDDAVKFGRIIKAAGIRLD